MSKPVEKVFFYDVMQDEEQTDGDSTEEIKLEPEDMNVDDTLEDSMERTNNDSQPGPSCIPPLGSLVPLIPRETSPAGGIYFDQRVPAVIMETWLHPWLHQLTPEEELASPSRPGMRASSRPRLDVTANSMIVQDSDSEPDDEDYDDEQESLISRQMANARRLKQMQYLEQQEMAAGGTNDEGSEDVDMQFSWTEDFSTFSGQKEMYQRQSGPTCSSQDPTLIFLQVWDEAIMSLIVSETNRYAQHCFEKLSDPMIGPGIPKYLESWEDITIEVLYRYFAALIIISVCQRRSLHEYWSTGVLEMPFFRSVMSRNEFVLITKFLHFVDNNEIATLSRHDRMLKKVTPVLVHCNERFSSIYIAGQYLSLDDGGRSWKQSIQTKIAGFELKCNDLCEAETGYVIRTRLHIDKEKALHPEPTHGFGNATAKLVLQLTEGYLDVGHILVMDSRYNQLALTRYLKSRRTDVLGTMSRARLDVPAEIKSLNPRRLRRGEAVSRHCGDIALIAWKDAKLVTVISTYHQMAVTRQDVREPVAVVDYNRHMGGVDAKDETLSAFRFERKKGRKWYMKVFRRLLNVSLLNAFIAYSQNPMHRVCTQREFRVRLVEGLVARFPRVSHQAACFSRTVGPPRLQPGNHFPVYLGSRPSGGARQLRCVRCKALAEPKRRDVKTICELCQVALCIGKCWADYHTRLDLSTP